MFEAKFIHYYLLPILAAASLGFSEPVAAQAVDKCDELASNADDPGSVAPGVSMEAMKGEEARDACLRSVYKMPEVPRFKYQLGRAYYKLQNWNQARLNFQFAANEGYAMAHYALGVVDYDATFFDRAAKHFQKAQELGITVADEYAQNLVFDASIFSDPIFFTGLYEGKLEGGGKPALSYIVQFTEYLSIAGCEPAMSLHMQAGNRATVIHLSDVGDLLESPYQGLGADIAAYADMSAQWATTSQNVSADAAAMISRYQCTGPVNKALLVGLSAWLNTL